MANVAKINGYDVKDAEARGDIADIQQALSTAQGDITTLQDDVLNTEADLGDITSLTTTVKTSAVNAINEVDSHADANTINIGNLAALNTVDKSDLVSAINEVEKNASYGISKNTYNFAPTFSDETSYAVGDYVTYNNVLYRCTTAHSAGVWVAGHFTYATVGNELQNVRAVPILKMLPTLSSQSIITFSDTQSETKSLISTSITIPRKGDLILCLPNFTLITTGPYQFNIDVEFAGDTYSNIYSVADKTEQIGYVPFLIRDVPAGTYIMDIKGHTTGPKNVTVTFDGNASYIISGTLY